MKEPLDEDTAATEDKTVCEGVRDSVLSGRRVFRLDGAERIADTSISSSSSGGAAQLGSHAQGVTASLCPDGGSELVETHASACSRQVAGMLRDLRSIAGRGCNGACAIVGISTIAVQLSCQSCAVSEPGVEQNPLPTGVVPV